MNFTWWLSQERDRLLHRSLELNNPFDWAFDWSPGSTAYPEGWSRVLRVLLPRKEIEFSIDLRLLSKTGTSLRSMRPQLEPLDEIGRFFASLRFEQREKLDQLGIEVGNFDWKPSKNGSSPMLIFSKFGSISGFKADFCYFLNLQPSDRSRVIYGWKPRLLYLSSRQYLWFLLHSIPWFYTFFPFVPELLQERRLYNLFWKNSLSLQFIKNIWFEALGKSSTLYIWVYCVHIAQDVGVNLSMISIFVQELRAIGNRLAAGEIFGRWLGALYSMGKSYQNVMPAYYSVRIWIRIVFECCKCNWHVAKLQIDAKS